MRIAFVNEGTYPVVTGGVSTWCHRLIAQLPEFDFHLVTVVGLERENRWPVLDNVRSLTVVPMWDPPRNEGAFRYGRRAQQARVRDALARLWAAVLPAHGERCDIAALRRALRDIAGSGRTPLATVFTGIDSTRAILDAWRPHQAANPKLPSLSASVAADVARQVDRTLAILDVEWPEVDVINVTANGAAALVGLVRHWRDGTPLILSEHGVYIRERYLALGAANWPWITRYLMMAFTRAICELAYADASALAPVSEFNSRWEVVLGADPRIIEPIPNAIDPTEFPEITTEPDVPTVSFLGRVDPLKDLATLISAFVLVRQSVPDARLRIFGPTPKGNEEYRAGLEQQIAELGLADAVTFEGPTAGPRPAIEAGHVIALSSMSEGLPFSVIESMMSGRATVNTDVGGVAECTGRDGSCGIVVPARDPQAMAASLAWLLTDSDARHRIGRAARERALERFSIEVFERRYRELYARLAGRLQPTESSAPPRRGMPSDDMSLLQLFDLIGAAR